MFLTVLSFLHQYFRNQLIAISREGRANKFSSCLVKGQHRIQRWGEWFDMWISNGIILLIFRQQSFSLYFAMSFMLFYEYYFFLSFSVCLRFDHPPFVSSQNGRTALSHARQAAIHTLAHCWRRNRRRGRTILLLPLNSHNCNSGPLTHFQFHLIFYCIEDPIIKRYNHINCWGIWIP